MKKCLSSVIAVVIGLSMLSFGSVALQAADVDVSLEISTNGSTWIGISPSPQSVPGSTAYVRPVIVPTGGGSPIAGEPVKVDMPVTGGEVDVSLTSSTDLSVWANETPGTITLADKKFFRAETIAFSLIPAGSFTMGSPVTELGREVFGGKETQHTVTLDNDFYLQQTEVTWDQWNTVRDWALLNEYTDLVTGSNGVGGDSSGNHPVTGVDWINAVKWLNAYSELKGFDPYYRVGVVGGEPMRTGNVPPVRDLSMNGYRLPTEAEWEYASRAGTTTAFYNGDITETGSSPVDSNLDQIGWYSGNSGSATHPVAQKLPNAWFLYDTAGNVVEWCWDLYSEDLGSSPVANPAGPGGSGDQRIFRGGSWSFDAEFNRAAFRASDIDDRTALPASTITGFRPARTAGGGT